MAIYRTGTFVVPAANAATTLNLGFIPSVFRCRDLNVFNSGTITGAIEGYFDAGLSSLATPMSVVTTYAAGAPTLARSTTNGILAFQSTDQNLFLPQQVPYTTNNSTNLTITGISAAANASITATHSFTTSDIGVTVVTFHGIVGMTQMNTLSGVIQTVTSTTSFTVNINSSSFTAYSSGGIANVITGAPVSTLYGNQILNTSEANLGFIGLKIGTDLMGGAGVTAADVFWYEAILQSPVTGP